MKIFFFILLTTVATVSCYGWKTQKVIKGSGNVKTEERNVGSFDQISASQGISVFLTQGDAKALVVKADDNILPYLETVVKKNTLEIRITQGINIDKGSKHVYVTVPRLTKINVTTAARIEGQTPWQFDKVDLNTTTAAEVILNLTATSLNVKMTTAGIVTLQGNTEKLEVHATTSANLNAEGLAARFVKVAATTGSNIKIDAIDQLGYKLTTGATLVYKGDPRITESLTSTGGSVKHRK